MSLQYPLPAGIRQVVPDYACDGVTILSFAIPFRFFQNADIWVGWASATALPPVAGAPVIFAQQIYGTEYTIAGAGLEAGGAVTFFAPPPAGLIRVMGLRTPSRMTSVVNDGALISTAFENELDVQEMTLQELRRDVSAGLAAMLSIAAALQGQLTALQAATGVPVTLPISLPDLPGLWWNDGGAVSIS